VSARESGVVVAWLVAVAVASLKIEAGEHGETKYGDGVKVELAGAIPCKELVSAQAEHASRRCV
jgi:hypothetical protein